MSRARQHQFLFSRATSDFTQRAGASSKFRRLGFDIESAHGAGAEAYTLTLLALNQSADLEELLSALPRSAAELAGAQEAFVVLRDGGGGLDAASFRTCNGPAAARLSDVQERLDSRSDFWDTLRGGLTVTLERSSEAGPALPLESILLVPLLCRSDVQGLLGLSFPNQGPRLRPMEVELLHQLCRRIGPVVARLREIDALRKENAALGRAAAGKQPEAVPGGAPRGNRGVQSIMELRSQFLSNIAHELRTPLVAIRGYTRMILQGAAGDITNTQREYLSIVAENTNRLVQSISNFLRAPAPQQFRPEPFDLRELWQECLRLIKPQAVEKALRINDRLPAEPMIVTGDREKLGYVFYILLSNAVRFTDASGEITVEFIAGSDEITVQVSDTGVGIPQELLDKLFDRYSHTEGSAARGSDNARVGLSVVHDILRLHGGDISVASRVGEGSTFVFTLPADTANQSQEGKSGNEQASDLRSRRR